MTDDELRDRIRRADPAASLEPLSPEHIASLIAPMMDAHQDLVSEPRLRGWKGRRGKPVIGATLLAAAAAGIFAGFWGSSMNDPGTPVPVVQRVRDGNDAALKCVPPTADGLRTAGLAVEGTVRGIDDGVVRIEVSRVWTGSDVDVLEVAQTSGASESLLGGSAFDVGKTYLVAVENGTVRGCGYSGVASAELLKLYEEAF